MSKTQTIAFPLLSALAMALASTATAAEPAPFRFETRATDVAEKPLKLDAALRPLPGNQDKLFFGGEFQARSIPFFALPDEAAAASKLVLTMQTAISVAPEQSKMTISVNGTAVGTTDLVAGDPRQIEYEIPNGIIHAGYNAITMQADQRHRVDCGIDATYELWTKIDPDRSGFVYSGVQKPSMSLVDLLPLSGSKGGRTDIRVVLPHGAETDAYDQATRVVQALTIFGNFDQPTVSFGQGPGTGPGIDLYIGTAAKLADYRAGGDTLTDAQAQGQVSSANNPRRKRLVLTGADKIDLEAHVKEFVSAAVEERPVGTAAGLAALASLKGRPLQPGETVELKDLGFVSKQFTGRYEAAELGFSMPSDFYPGDYSNINLHMTAQYSAGLSPNAVLIVKANGKEVANIPLSSTRDGEIRDQRLPIPFSALRPGQNSLTIEARLNAPADVACETVDKASDHVRLFIDDRSYLDVPNYARIGRYPEISSLTSGLLPGSAGRDGVPISVFVPEFNSQAMNAAATFLAKMAFSSHQIMQAGFTSVLPPLDAGNVIAFSSYDTLPSELAARMKLDLSSRTAKGAASLPFEVASLSGLQTSQPESIADAASERSTRKPMDAGLAQFAKSLLDNPSDTSAVLFARFKSEAITRMQDMNLKYMPALLGAPDTSNFTPSPGSSLVVAQASTGTGSLWTVVAARNSEEIQSQTDVLTHSDVWNRLGGAAQGLSQTGAIVDEKASVDVQLFETEPLTLQNARLIAAGWLANNAEIYVSALLGAAIALGFGTFMVVKTGRRKHG